MAITKTVTCDRNCGWTEDASCLSILRKFGWRIKKGEAVCPQCVMLEAGIHSRFRCIHGWFAIKNYRMTGPT